MRNRQMVMIGCIVAAACSFGPASLGGQEQTPPRDVLIRVEGPITVAASDTIGTLWVIGNNATILGTVRELVMINGVANVEGTIQGNLVLIKGTALLGPSARVEKDVLSYRSAVRSATGSHIGGTVHNELGVSFGARALWLLWLSVTIAMIVAGLVLGYFASDSLGRVADGLTSDWRGSLFTAVAIVVGLPAAAIISFMTGIGFVLGFFILFVMIPFMCLAGYVVLGTSLGRAILGVRRGDSSRMFTAIALGILAMQAVAVIPGIGGLIVILGSQLGAGALVYRTWKKGHSIEVRPRLIMQPA